MANTNAPFGFRQWGGTGASPTYEQVAITNGTTGGILYNQTAIYYGDPVVRNGTGDPTLLQATTGTTTPLVGIFVGCKYLSTSQKRTVWSNYWPGSDVSSANQSTIEAYVINDPLAQFVCQSDATGIPNAAIGANVSFNIGTGTAANGLSGAYITNSSINTTSTLSFRIIGLVLNPPGAPGTSSGAYNWVIVAFNNLESKNLTSYVAT